MQVTGLVLWCGAVVTAPPCAPDRVQSSRLATQLAGPRRTLRSTLHDRFHVQDSPTHPGPRGLHPQRADFQSNSTFVSSLATPTVCRAFQSFGALRNLPCAARETVRALFRCRISLRLSNKVGARASGPLWRVCLKSLRKCGPEARAPTCKGLRVSMDRIWTAGALAGNCGSITTGGPRGNTACRRGRRRSRRGAEARAPTSDGLRVSSGLPELSALAVRCWRRRIS